MAAREHQGLQIALIIFAMLTIALGVTTFMFFNNYKEEHIKTLNEQKSAKKSEENLRKTIDEMTELKRLMGYGPRDEVTAIVGNHKKDMETYGKTFPEAQQHYRHVVENLATQLHNVNGRLIDRDAREREYEAKIATDETVKKKEIDEYKDNVDKTTKDAVAERDKFNQDRDKKTKSEADIARKLDEKRKELEQIAETSSKNLEQMVEKLKTVTTTNENLVAKGQKEEFDSEQSDGKITWVNQRSRIVWLNLGADDGLRRQISFTVLGADENNPLKADKKGSIEVTRVLDHHLAEARIIEDDPSKPLMPGDQVFSAAWQPGRVEHFALVGFMDLDGDELSDRDRIKDIITLNGGIIDAELKDDGTRKGDMTVHTRYLVLGDRPNEKNTNGDYLTNYSKMIGEAKGLPIKTISVQELLDYLGYEAKERTIPLGPDSKASDFKPRAPEDVQRKSSNNMFKPRRATPTGGRKSAY